MIKSILQIKSNKKILVIFLPVLIINLWLSQLILFYSQLQNPLDFEYYNSRGNHLLILHGYNGYNSQFEPMINYLDDNNYFKRDRLGIEVSLDYFDFYKSFTDIGYSKEEIHNLNESILTLSEKLYENIQHSKGKIVDIIAHSLGGIIVRLMLKNHYLDLLNFNISMNKVITLGTPHLGITNDINSITLGLEDNDLVNSLCKGSEFILNLNENTSSMQGIRWYFFAGVSYHPFINLAQNVLFGGTPCDGLVDYISALALNHLDSISTISRKVLFKDHERLITDYDSNDTYELIYKILNPQIFRPSTD